MNVLLKCKQNMTSLALTLFAGWTVLEMVSCIDSSQFTLNVALHLNLHISHFLYGFCETVRIICCKNQQELITLGDNCIQKFNLGRYVVGYTVGNLGLRRRESYQTITLFVLVLYVPSQQLWSWRDGQFTKQHFFLGKLEQAVNQYFVHILSLVTDNSHS